MSLWGGDQKGKSGFVHEGLSLPGKESGECRVGAFRRQVWILEEAWQLPSLLEVDGCSGQAKPASHSGTGADLLRRVALTLLPRPVFCQRTREAHFCPTLRELLLSGHRG